MPHVTFVHGLANKPPPQTLHDIWLRALAAGNGLDLVAEGVSTSMCYWADVLYASPDTGDDAAPVPQYLTRATPGDPATVPQRSRV